MKFKVALINEFAEVYVKYVTDYISESHQFDKYQ